MKKLQILVDHPRLLSELEAGLSLLRSYRWEFELRVFQPSLNSTLRQDINQRAQALLFITEAEGASAYTLAETRCLPLYVVSFAQHFELGEARLGIQFMGYGSSGVIRSVFALLQQEALHDQDLLQQLQRQQASWQAQQLAMDQQHRQVWAPPHQENLP